ncbi:MAG: sialidase [Roseburia sp.]|nr:sialidase [Roseburia sp.]
MGRKRDGVMGKRMLSAALVAVMAALLCLAAGGAAGKDDGMKITDYHSELFGENVYIFSPEDDPAVVAQLLADVYDVQETNQFGGERYAFYFLPGEYDESIQPEVGFYTQVAGLGTYPGDTRLAGLSCLARWLGEDENNHNACCNFWRSLENIAIGSNTVWAVSQATDVRRIQVGGALYLHDEYGWCSGGFLADSKITRLVDSGSQQQWLARNSEWAAWMGENWNMVFVGEAEGCAPGGTWPVRAYTEVENTGLMREKPFLVWDEKEGFGVCIPGLRQNSTGVSWSEDSEVRWVSDRERKRMGAETDVIVGIGDFYVAKAETDTAETINAALAGGKNLLLTPGVYRLDAPLCVEQADTVVLGMGLATLESTDGNVCLQVADESGIMVAGLLFDAGSIKADNLMVVGTGEKAGEKELPIVLSDLYFRVGGAPTSAPATVEACITIHSDDVVGDNFWVWRADHGDQVAWDKNTAKNGLIVNGDDVQIYALMVEHFNEWQTVWNGNGGRVYMYQSEIPYDVPSQSAWLSHDGTVDGYSSFHVADSVTDFYATGLGIYLYNRDIPVRLHSAMECPDAPGVRVEHICTVMLNGYPGMEHIINDSGGAVIRTGERQILLEYENGAAR